MCIRHVRLTERLENHVERVSFEICTIMTRLGYSEEIRRWRVEKYKEQDRLVNARFSDKSFITAGSKAEGLTCFFESDMDILYVMEGVLCVEAGFNLHTIPGDIGVFRMDTRVYPGHCRLLQERRGHTHSNRIHNCLCDNGYGDILLSSSLFLDEYSESSADSYKVFHEREGPSTPWTADGVLHVDRVLALRCQCPSILQRWAARPRHWPSPDTVQKVVSFGAFVTPVGFKESETKHMEWRTCLNTGESELVNNLNGTQAQVYVMLKTILKDVLRPCKKEVTSYVIKNILLWQAESNSQDEFDTRSFFHWLHAGLRELKTAIATQQLSYNMIPERNLMAGSDLQDQQKSQWLTDITNMMAEGPRVILRLPKIRKAVVASPEPMLWFSKKRMELEMLFVEFWNRRTYSLSEDLVPDEYDDIQHEISRRMRKLMVEVAQRMHVEGCAVYDLWAIQKRMLM
ncbi:uncharacterized protein LOC127851706 isoform X2 [Dreissena polymorpha]|uniref:uncharacterized protein LOC127851706 isoform X2 n=1 Tax=Dreissena polymorpha TaxID=45954 RepID=UPI0022654501|nr:uncharacterized protein LOC127851706 isoform X2 [Dreissena polymorpha]